MNKYAVVIDSTVYLTDEEFKKFNPTVVSLNVVDGVESFREIDVVNDFIFDRQKAGSSFTTSQPSPGVFLENYERLIKEGYEKVYYIGLSSEISGTYQSANLAKKMFDTPEKIYTFDTLLAAFGASMVALKLFELIEEGKDSKYIEETIEAIIINSNQLFTVENLFFLARGGRLSKTSATLGTVLRVKPIIRLIDGKLELVHKERTYAKLSKYFVKIINETVPKGSKITFRLTDTNSLDSVTMLKAALLNEFPDAILSQSHYLGPVFAIHVGPKAFGLSWFFE
ncbi:MAG: DegV family protein [Candidatus Izemoplasma sp.]